jgi:DNA-directed RNA polymerase specialized sigma24 family protein
MNDINAGSTRIAYNVQHLSLDEVQDTLPSEDEPEYEISSEILRNAIDQLSPDLREALVLRVYSGFSYTVASVTTRSRRSPEPSLRR